MPHAHFLGPTDPGPPALTPRLDATASLTADLSAAATTTTSATRTTFLPSAGEDYLQLHSVLIIVLFSVVCLLLLVAFFYTFCFRCSIQPTPKAPRQDPCQASLDREDATYRHSSSDLPSVGNVV